MFRSNIRNPISGSNSNSYAVMWLIGLLLASTFPSVVQGGAVYLTDHASGTTGQDFAAAICSLSDLNSDGSSEILVGAPTNNGAEDGAAFIWYGTNDVTHSAAQSWSGSNGERFGFSVAAIGDVNNDGDADFAIGAPLSDVGGTEKGRVHIFYGGSSLSSSADLIIGGAAGGDQFGFSIFAAGDFDGDGKDDFIVGAPYANSPAVASGAAYVIFGATGGPSTDLADALMLSGENANDHFGWSVCSAGNFLNGNVECVAVGAPDNTTQASAENSGAVYVFEGSDHPSTPDASSDHIITTGSSSKAHSSFGWVVRSAGHWDSDSVDDLAIGAPHNNQGGTEKGRVEIVFGGSTPSSQGDRYFSGENGGDQLGYSLADLGDFSGSSANDLLIGAPYYSLGGNDAGRAYILEGGSSSGGASGLDIIGSDPLVPDTSGGDRFGFAVCGVTDFDGDGDIDYAIGAPSGNIANNALAGFCRIWASNDQTVAAFPWQASSLWLPDGQVQVSLNLPVSAEEIHHLRLYRQQSSGWMLVHDGSAVGLASDCTAAGCLFQWIDAGPFENTGPIKYRATLILTDGRQVELNGDTSWLPLSMNQRPESSLMMVQKPWPNPAKSNSILSFRVAEGQNYSIQLSDLRGRIVRRLQTGQGTGTWTNSPWDGKDDSGRDLPAGMYFFQLRCEGQSEIRKVMLTR
ncbi:MAG: T9SS type A sorting domain-containing protein [bacterium]|nr:T9SS type A sorting domain-containing protein [bacterium]